MARALPQSFEIRRAELARRSAEREAEASVHRTDIQEHANAVIFARECEAVGMPADSLVGPALLRAMGRPAHRPAGPKRPERDDLERAG